MNSVNQENIKQNNTKTFSSNTKRQSNTFQSAQTKKVKNINFKRIIRYLGNQHFVEHLNSLIFLLRVTLNFALFLGNLIFLVL